jgi:hypothetical protein
MHWVITYCRIEKIVLKNHGAMLLSRRLINYVGEGTHMKIRSVTFSTFMVSLFVIVSVPAFAQIPWFSKKTTSTKTATINAESITSKFSFEPKTDRSQPDISVQAGVANEKECAIICYKNSACDAFTWERAGWRINTPRCWLKGKGTKASPNDNLISGIRKK